MARPGDSGLRILLMVRSLRRGNAGYGWLQRQVQHLAECPRLAPLVAPRRAWPTAPSGSEHRPDPARCVAVSRPCAEAAMRGQQLLFDPADRQHPPGQLHLAGHRDFGSDRCRYSKEASAVVIVTPALGPSFGTAPPGRARGTPGPSARPPQASRRHANAGRTTRSTRTPSSRRRADRSGYPGSAGLRSAQRRLDEQHVATARPVTASPVATPRHRGPLFRLRGCAAAPTSGGPA